MTDEIKGDLPEIEESVTFTASSTETTEQEVEDASEEPKIPLSRLRKETDKRRVLETKLESFEKELSELKKDKTITTDEERKAKDYLRTMIKETYQELRESEKKAESTQDAMFKDALTEIKDVYPELVKSEKSFLKFFEEGRFEDSVDGMWGAAKIYSEMKKSGGTTTKPKLPSGARTTDNIKKNYDVKGKDIYQIIAEAKEEGKSSGQI
jgi:flagellar hook-basal body complex protein FliE